MDLFGKKAAKKVQELENTLITVQENASKREQELEHLLVEAQQKLSDLGYDKYADVKAEIDRKNKEIEGKNSIIENLCKEIERLKREETKLFKQNRASESNLSSLKALYGSVKYAISNFFEYEPQLDKCKLPETLDAEIDILSPSIMLKLHLMDVKSLRKAYKENDKQIESLLAQYSGRYTTKANQTIYQLMVIALRAELQNILYNLKYEKLDTAIEQVKVITTKYLAIATNGNQLIAGTMTKFIGQIEYLFINAVKIEYNYYVKKEQARQEQLEIREKMKQEAAERKALAVEKKKVEAEESKYVDEIERVRQQLQEASDAEAATLNKRILELEAMLSDVVVKKEEIVNLQNGKAGSIYVISNLGSFGENMFKIGMTRRLNPQDRIDELGSASVPFKFDVHCFVFSENAVDLESRLHQTLNDKRVNKVNLRKEFFYSSVDELEKLVESIDPTAEFNKTMLAEEFRQSQSTDSPYISDYSIDSEI